MKKYIVIILAVFLIMINNLTIADINNKNTESEEITIYQISPFASNPIKTTYLKSSNPINTNKISKDNSNNSINYVILTTDDIANEITSSDFILWKNSLGYNVKIINITDSYIQDQPGADLPALIRNFLREYYPIWGIQFLLIIGSHYSIPMRYCYPNPENHVFDIFDSTSGEVPTDYYYADLSLEDDLSWDSDNDGYYGEYTHDSPDFSAEIYVGRIPIDDISRIIYTLDKTMVFEQDIGIWKHNALNAGAFFYFNNENNYYSKMDGADLSYYIEQDIMNGWTISHYSEQEGLEISVYDWPAIGEAAFISDWRDNKYGIVNWQGHGWTNGVARKIWAYDDGDSIPEGNEMTWPYFITLESNLDDDYPSIVTAVSCYVGCPEPNGESNLGIDLLTKPSFGASIGVIASARSPYGSYNWSPSSPGGSDSIIYEFNKNLILNNERVGEALYNSKYYCNYNYGWDNYAEYIDMYTFNLFGDPSLLYGGDTDNYPPNMPQINGPISGETGTEYDYSFVTSDPENDDVYYFIDWGDGDIEEWIGPFNSGEQISLNHTWSEENTYLIRVKAKDLTGAESPWAVHEVSMPKNKNYFKYWISWLFELLVEYFPRLEQVLYSC